MMAILLVAHDLQIIMKQHKRSKQYMYSSNKYYKYVLCKNMPINLQDIQKVIVDS